jgi:hypothetical protein
VGRHRPWIRKPVLSFLLRFIFYLVLMPRFSFISLEFIGAHNISSGFQFVFEFHRDCMTFQSCRGSISSSNTPCLVELTNN